jgi:hypothetical protein
VGEQFTNFGTIDRDERGGLLAIDDIHVIGLRDERKAGKSHTAIPLLGARGLLQFFRLSLACK